MIYLWRGFHSETLLAQLKAAWLQDELVVLCPPYLNDFSFIRFLPEGEIKITGDFSPEHQSDILTFAAQPRQTTWPSDQPLPIIGIFTSGTLSGIPRLILNSKQNIESALAGVRSFFDTDQIKEIFCYPQPFHTFGLTLGYIQSILYDLKLWIYPGKYTRGAHEFRSTINTEKLLTLGAPAHFYDLDQYLKAEHKKLASSYSCIVGGAKVSVDLWNSLKDDLNIQMPSIGYGSTEACPGITHHPPGLRPLEEGEIGHPLPGLELKIIPDEGLEFKGKNVCLAVIEKNYILFPNQMLIRDSITRRDSDGIWIYQGRTDLMLNRGGSKYSLESLEDFIHRTLNLPVICFSTSDTRLGEDLGVCFQTSDPIEPLIDKTKAALLDRYGHHFELKHALKVDRLPHNENGKIDRRQFRH